MLSLLLLLSSSITASSQTLYECADYEGCVNLGIIRENKIECSGSSSCYNTPISTARGKDIYARCSGERSCYSADTITQNDVFCTGAYACYGVTIDTVSGNNVKCMGYFSCGYGSYINAENDIICDGGRSCNSDLAAGNKVYCQGAESCLNHYGKTIAGDDIYCGGRESCAGIATQIHTPTTLVCGGRLSCQGLHIYEVGQAVKLYGYLATQDAYIKDTPLVLGYGKSVLRNTFINSSLLSNMTVKLFGTNEYVEGEENVFQCRDGAECNLECKGSACLGLEYRCESGSICNIEPNGCLTNSGGIEHGVNCPVITDGTTIVTIHDFEFYEEDDVYRHDEAQESQRGESDDDEIRLKININSCDTEGSCIGSNLTGLSQPQCRGSNSCRNATTSDLSTQIKMSCLGKQSCHSATIYTPNYRDLYCDGEESCKSAKLLVGTNVLCNGYKSCQSIIQLSDTHLSGNINCAGTLSCKSSVITVTGDGDWIGHARCKGVRSCLQSTITASEYIGCDGEYSCSHSTLTCNDNGNERAWYAGLHCWGSKSCVESVLYASHSLTMDGHLAGYQSMIYGKNKTLIRGRGYKSLAYSIIDSDGTNVMRVILSGHLSGFGATYICRNESVCHLNCRGTGCKNVDFVCMDGAICNVYPTECGTGTVIRYRGNICPNMMVTSNVNEFVEKKVIDRENNEIYKEIEEEIMMDQQQFEFMELSEYDEAIAVDKEDKEFFFDSINVNHQILSNHEMIFIFVMFSIFTIFPLFYHGWNKMKYNDYQQL